MAHGPTSLPSILRVATGESSFIEIFSTVFTSLRCYRANGLPKTGESRIILMFIENRGFSDGNAPPATGADRIGDERWRRDIVSETMASSHSPSVLNPSPA